MVTWTQVNNTTWIATFKGIDYLIDKYYDGGYTIRYREGIYSSREEITSDLIKHY